MCDRMRICNKKKTVNNNNENAAINMNKLYVIWTKEIRALHYI